MTEPYVVGETVVRLPSANDRGDARTPRHEQIARVGRKYVFLLEYGREVAYEIETGGEKTDYPGSQSRIMRPADYERKLARETATNLLHDLGMEARGYGGFKYSTEALEQVIEILQRDRNANA